MQPTACFGVPFSGIYSFFEHTYLQDKTIQHHTMRFLFTFFFLCISTAPTFAQESGRIETVVPMRLSSGILQNNSKTRATIYKSLSGTHRSVVSRPFCELLLTEMAPSNILHLRL